MSNFPTHLQSKTPFTREQPRQRISSQGKTSSFSFISLSLSLTHEKELAPTHSSESEPTAGSGGMSLFTFVNNTVKDTNWELLCNGKV
jgi:hypothetical protein